MSRGFTLIELLVVIAIIGVLSSVVLASLNSARGKANDAARLSDMNTMQTALELYATSHNGTYPNSNNTGCGGWETTGSDASTGHSFVQALVADGDMPSGMKDPQSATESTCGNLDYYYYGANSYGCTKPFYVIGIRSTDAAGSGKYSTSPGWSCPSRDWQTEFRTHFNNNHLIMKNPVVWR